MGLLRILGVEERGGHSYTRYQMLALNDIKLDGYKAHESLRLILLRIP